MAVDVLGLGVTVGVNAGLLAVVATAHIFFLKASWFTDPIFQLTRRRPQSLSTLLLMVLALSLMAWAFAWERSSMESWRWQNALAIWCWILTVFHAIGAASLVL